MTTDHQNPGSSLGNVIVTRYLNEETPSLIDEDAHELKILLQTSTKVESNKDVNIGIEAKVEAEVTPWITRIERSDGVTEFNISNCTTSFFIIKFFESPDIAEWLMDLKSILLVKFQFFSSFDEIGIHGLAELSQKCSSKGVVIQLATINDVKSSTYWKSMEFQRFLKVKPISNVQVGQKKEFNDFSVDFLIEALKNRQSGLASTFVLKPEISEVDIDFLADSRDFNLLLQACEKGNVKIVRTGLEQGMNTSLQGSKVTAQSLALQNGHYDVILVLAEANLTFPKSLDIRKYPEEFRVAYNTTKILHEYIKANNVDRAKEILNVNPQKRYFYNLRNESAIKVAILNESMESYELLLSHKLRFGPHEDSEVLLRELTAQNKRIAREIHNRHAQDSPMKQINILLANSYICHDVENSEAKMKYVNRAYRALNTNLLIRMLLMIVAASRKFKIIFDFNRDSVSAADPTVDANTQGLFYLSGRIYIGAKQLLNEATEHETLATMAHELCHYVMNLVYKNEARPYPANDIKAMQELEDISEKCQSLIGVNDVVDLVYECYPPEAQHAELIVRVVHLLALYQNQPEELKEVSETYSDLFEFYEKTIHPQLEQVLPEIEEKAEKESDEKDDLIFKYKFLLIFGGILSGILIVAGFFVLKHFFFPNYIFAELSENDKNDIRNAPINYKNIELKFVDLFPKDSQVYNKLTSNYIQQMFAGDPLNLSYPYLAYLNLLINHEWENMTEKLKEKVLCSNFIFQNEILRLELLNDTVPQVFASLTSEQIVEVLEGKKLRVGDMITNDTTFYIERKIIYEDLYIIYYQFDMDSKFNRTRKDFKDYSNDYINDSKYDKKIAEIKKDYNFREVITKNKNIVNGIAEVLFDLNKILEIAFDKKIFILSAEAGTGKTVTFEQLTMLAKRKFPMRWVSYIDLKGFTKFYNRSGVLDDHVKLMENILRLGPGNEFEKEIFWELFKSGDVVLFWNGYDEISPDFNDFILKIFSLIRENTKNVQFVCTRPLYSEKLNHRLNSHVFELVPLTKHQQTEVLEKFLISENFTVQSIGKYMKKIETIISRVNSEKEFDSPIMLIMFATIVSNDVEIYDSENIFQIYEKFINTKIKIWTNSELGSKFIQQNYGKKVSMLDIFLKYSLKQYYKKVIRLFNLKLMRTKVPHEITKDEVSRTGILYLNGPNEFQFAHKTFQEFFVAKFLCNNIYNNDDEVDISKVEVVADILNFVIMDPKSNSVIIKFMISYFDVQTDPVKKINAHISEILRTKYKKIFFSLIWQMTIEGLDSFLRMFQNNHELVIDLLHVNEYETFYTAFFNPAYYYGPFVNSNLENLKNLTGNYLSEDELEKFINGRNQKGKILFSQFYWHDIHNEELKHDTYNLDVEILKSKNFSLFFEKVVMNLTEQEVDELFLAETSQIYPFAASLLKKSSKDYEIVEKFLIKKGKYQIFLKNLVEPSNFKWFRAQQTNFLETLENVLIKSKYELNDIIPSDALVKLAMDSIRSFDTFWGFLKKYTNKTQQRQLLMHETSEICFDDKHIPSYECPETPPFNFFHVVCIHNFIVAGYKDFLFDFYKLFDVTEMQEMILKSNDYLFYSYFYGIFNELSGTDDYTDCVEVSRILIKNDTIFGNFTKQKFNIINMSISDYKKYVDQV